VRQINRDRQSIVKDLIRKMSLDRDSRSSPKSDLVEFPRNLQTLRVNIVKLSFYVVLEVSSHRAAQCEALFAASGEEIVLR
jgi:hypothetical protein